LRRASTKLFALLTLLIAKLQTKFAMLPLPCLYSLSDNLTGVRLDCALAQIAGISRSEAAGLIKSGRVLVANIICSSPSFKVKGKEQICLLEKSPSACALKFDLLYEDENLLVVNKPAGLAVYKGAGMEENTLTKQLTDQFPLSSFRGEERLGIVHRLDKDTSGTIVIAKNNFAHMKLEEQIKDGQMERKYLVLAWGRPSDGVIETHLKPSKTRFGEVEVCSNKEGKIAFTECKSLCVSKHASLLECNLKTGRTHQIRVHMAHIGSPVIGDQTYGKDFRRATRSLKGEKLKAVLSFKRQALHAHSVSFVNFDSGRKISILANLPKDMLELCSLLDIDFTSTRS
jgi:23S rRNA pseudouridine1911/1915/1917 synthase